MTDLYWVGGTSTWNATAGSKWALTSGGVGGQPVPTGSDNVYIDALSGAVTVTIGSAVSCLSLDCSGLAGLAHFTGTLAGSSALNIASSLTLVSEMTYTYTGTMTFSSTSTGKTITFGGKTTANSFIFNGVGGVWTVQDNWNNGTNNLTLTNGSIDTNGKTCTLGSLLCSSASTSSLTFGASIINISGALDLTGSGFSLSSGTSTINYSTGNSSCDLGGRTYYNFVMTGIAISSEQPMTGVNTFNNLTRTNASGYVQLLFSNNQTINGIFTVTGNNVSSQRIYVNSNIIGTNITITAAAVSLTNVDFKDITGAGSATWSGTSLGNCGRNSGITFTTPVNRYWIQDAGVSTAFTASNWATSSGGTPGANYPLPQDTAFFDANSFSTGSKTVTIGTNTLRLPAISFTGVTNQPTFNLGNTWQTFGAIILNTGVTLSGTSAGTFFGTVASITTGTVTFPSPIIINAPSGTFTFNDAFSSTAGITLTAGTLATGSNAITSTVFTCTGSATRVLTGSGIWAITSTGTVVNVASTGFTNSHIGTFKLTDSSSSSKTFAGGGATFTNFWNATGSTGVCNITGSNTFVDFKIDGGRTQQFTAGTTTTFATLTRGSGVATSVITIGSITASGHALVKTGNGNISLDYLSVSRSNASPVNTFYAGVNSTDGGNNTGWLFTSPINVIMPGIMNLF